MLYAAGWVAGATWVLTPQGWGATSEQLLIVRLGVHPGKTAKAVGKQSSVARLVRTDKVADKGCKVETLVKTDKVVVRECKVEALDKADKVVDKEWKGA